MLNLVKKFLREEDGPTAVEYAVMLALIVAVCIAAVNLMATRRRTASTRRPRTSTACSANPARSGLADSRRIARGSLRRRRYISQLFAELLKPA